jgi:hypothetical protein
VGVIEMLRPRREAVPEKTSFDAFSDEVDMANGLYT